MALETLKGIDAIGGFKITRFPDAPEELFIGIIEDVNTICFKLQAGPVKEVGVNGCQVDTLILTALIMIEKLNEKFPCKENENTIDHLNYALDWQHARTKNREARGVEGTSQA